MSTTTSGPPRPSPSVERGGAGSKAMLVLGLVTVLVALALLAGGAAAVWALGQRDKSGYFTTERHRVSTPSYAFASSGLDIGPDAPGWIGDLAGVRIEASSSQPVFLGIGRTRDVAQYLAGVRHAQVTDFETDPFRLTSHEVAGLAKPAPPGAQTIWRVQAAGPGLQTIKWPLEKGNWSVVAMNADGSPNVSVSLGVGARVPDLRWIAIGLLTGGAIVLVLGGGLIWLAVRERHAGSGVPPTD